MSNFNLKLDLSKLEGFGEIKLTGKSGKQVDCIVIPKELNHIYCSEKGGRYLDLVCFETPESEYGSHLVTMSKTKEEQEQEKATGERIRKPILGNLKEFGTQRTEVEEYTYQPQATQQPTSKTTAAPAQEEDDDMPF